MHQTIINYYEDINSNNEELVDKVFKILTKFKNSPKKIENIFTELFEKDFDRQLNEISQLENCLLYTSPSPRDGLLSRMPSSA